MLPIGEEGSATLLSLLERLSQQSEVLVKAAQQLEEDELANKVVLAHSSPGL